MKKTILILTVSASLFSCSINQKLSYKVDNCPKWANSIHNPTNAEYIQEIAFNLDKPINKVTQDEFNNRYLNQ